MNRDAIMAVLRDVECRSRQRQAEKDAAARKATAERQQALRDQLARRPMQQPRTPPTTLAERIYYGRR